MTNEQAIEYLIAEGVLTYRARKRKRVRQYAYVAECWHRHLINMEAALQAVERVSTRYEMDEASFRARWARAGEHTRKRWRDLLSKTVFLSKDEQEELKSIIVQVYG